MATFPIRCYTCNKVISYKLPYFLELQRDKEKNINEKEILDLIGMDRICCRRLFITFIA